MPLETMLPPLAHPSLAGPAFLLLALSIAVQSPALLAQSAPLLSPPPAAVVQEKVREWVRVQETISQEEARWREEQQQLRDLTELRRREIREIDEVLAIAGERVAEIEARQANLAQEEQGLRAGRDLLLQRIGSLEARARALLPSFPPPLRDKLGETLTRLEHPDPDQPVQNRYRDLLAVLIEAGNFNREITVHTELRQIGDQERELRVLYLGLASAYYVDRTGQHAGTGSPGAEGWVWTEIPALAGEIQRAISIRQKEAPPALVRLPIQIAP